jgi:hypothetical protein
MEQFEAGVRRIRLLFLGGVETLGACWKVVGMELWSMGIEIEWSSVRGMGLEVMCYSSVELLRYPLSQERYTAREECNK